jgi:hypothetical protein
MPSLAPFGQAVSEEKTFLTVANQKQELPLAAIFVAERGEMRKLYRGIYIDAFFQAWFHLSRLFQRRRLKCEKVNGRTTDAK